MQLMKVNSLKSSPTVQIVSCFFQNFKVEILYFKTMWKLKAINNFLVFKHWWINNDRGQDVGKTKLISTET